MVRRRLWRRVWTEVVRGLAVLMLAPAGGRNAAAQSGGPFARGGATVAEPTSPAAQHFLDRRSGISFDLPAGWRLARRDGELSAFSLDARSAPRNAHLRAAAQIDFNPYPASTFSGALLYLTVAPQSSAGACMRQAASPAGTPARPETIGGVPFQHGYGEHGAMCVEARDDVFTAMREGACVRFDLVVHTFCEGSSPGARDLTPAQLGAVEGRLRSILDTVRFEPPIVLTGR